MSSSAPGMEPGPHLDLLTKGVEHDGVAFRHLLSGEKTRAAAELEAAADHYRRSWELAPPRSYGRLVAMLTSAVLAGDAAEESACARDALAGACDSPTSCYALAIAAVVEGDDALALDAIEGMRAGGEAFERAADGLEAIVRSDESGVADAVAAIVADFESRKHYLTGVPIADTALMVEALATTRGLFPRRPFSAWLPRLV